MIRHPIEDDWTNSLAEAFGVVIGSITIAMSIPVIVIGMCLYFVTAMAVGIFLILWWRLLA